MNDGFTVSVVMQSECIQLSSLLLCLEKGIYLINYFNTIV